MQKLPNFKFVSRNCSCIFGGKINIDNTSESIKCGNLLEKSGNLPLCGKKGNDLTDFYGNFV